jgi:UDP-2-acetamido-3-amino-2,3-dideoxy-glucuronate N-acetyltransferase
LDGGVGDMKIAVVGTGYWGKNHVRNFYELKALEGIYDSDPRVVASLKEVYSGIKAYSNYEEVLKSDVEGIVLATPAITHYVLAKQALLAGKHVLVEKPLALEESDGNDLVECGKKAMKRLMVGHVLQYHSAVIKLKELIEAGELGKIQYIYSNRLNIGRIRTEENILWSFAPHDLSVMLMLLNEIPISVKSTGGSYLQQGVADVTMTTLDFASGVKGHIFVSWLHPFKEQKLIVVGDKKMAVFDDLEEEKLKLYAHTVEWHQRMPIAIKAKAEVIPLEKLEPLKEECTHFMECISNGTKPRTDGEEGLNVLKVLTACENSLCNGGREINVEVNRKNRNKSKEESNARIEERLDEINKDVYVHQTSYIDEDVRIGKNSKIWHFSHILKGSRIGSNCNIGQNVMIGPEVEIGDRCKVQNNVSIYKGVKLENEVFCGPSVVFTNVYNPRASIKRMDEMRRTVVKRGATIGANATIVCGVNIGNFALIGAGSLVNRDVDDYALVVGNPARRIGWMCECGVRLDNKLMCVSCGQVYKENEADLSGIHPL